MVYIRNLSFSIEIEILPENEQVLFSRDLNDKPEPLDNSQRNTQFLYF